VRRAHSAAEQQTSHARYTRASTKNEQAGGQRGGTMTQLMVVPIRDKGDCILVVALNNGRPLMGYVAKATLDEYFACHFTSRDGVRLVRSNLERLKSCLLPDLPDARKTESPALR